MKHTLITIAVSVLLILGFANTPAYLYSFKYWFAGPNLGTVYTTIATTDNLADFPATYNANNVAFDTSKIEVGTTSVKSITTLPSLVSLATITTGVWNGTPITVPYGGTGSTTLQQYAVLLGSSTNPVHAVTGLGTSGQSLVSNGPGAAPSWQSVSFDTSQAFTLTGLWNFTAGSITSASSTHSATTTVVCNSATNNALVLNTIPYRCPPAQGTASTTLFNDGNGNLVWGKATSTFAAGVISEVAVTASGNNDTVITTGFQPAYIILDFAIQGHDEASSDNKFFGMKGRAFFNGTTLVKVFPAWKTGTLSGVALTADDGIPDAATSYVNNLVADTSIATYGTAEAGDGDISVTLSISSISATGFTIRCLTDIGGGVNSNNARCKVGWEAYR